MFSVKWQSIVSSILTGFLSLKENIHISWWCLHSVTIENLDWEEEFSFWFSLARATSSTCLCHQHDLCKLWRGFILSFFCQLFSSGRSFLKATFVGIMTNTYALNTFFHLSCRSQFNSISYHGPLGCFYDSFDLYNALCTSIGNASFPFYFTFMHCFVLVSHRKLIKYIQVSDFNLATFEKRFCGF